MARREAIKATFLQLKQELSEDLVNTALELCAKFGLSEEELATKWEAYILNNNLATELPSRESLRSFAADLQDKSSVKVNANHKAPKTYNKDTMPKFQKPASQIFNKFGVAAPKTSSKPKKVEPTPAPIETDDMDYAFEGMDWDTFDEDIEKSIEQVEQKVVQHVLPKIEADKRLGKEERKKLIDIKELQSCDKYKFMFEKVDDRVVAFDGAMENIQQYLRRFNSLPKEGLLTIPSESQVVLTGRVCSETPDTALAECHTYLTDSLLLGRKVLLDFRFIPHLSLFPGQVIGVKGQNNGERVIVHEIYYETSPNANTIKGKEKEKEKEKESEGDEKEPNVAQTDFVDRFFEKGNQKGGFKILVAAGPFTPANSFSYSSLHRLCAFVEKEKPDLLMLVGPFVDVNNPTVAAGEVKGHNGKYLTFEEFFEDNLLVPIHDRFTKGGKPITNLLIVPSIQDAHFNHSILPQPPFPFRDDTGLKFLSNPSIFEAEGVRVAVTSQDVLSDIAGTIYEKGYDGDNTERILRAFLQQRQFYPVYPPPSHAHVDSKHLSDMAMSHKPDILVLPSKMDPFVKVLDKDVVCVNPGSLGKGSYAMVTVHPEDGLHTLADRTESKIIQA